LSEIWSSFSDQFLKTKIEFQFLILNRKFGGNIMKKYRPINVSTYKMKNALMVYLKTHNIYGEPSAMFDWFHIEILCDENEYENIVSFLESLI
jgi:hypothetical protein